MSDHPAYVLREMQYEDIGQVIIIDRLSFPVPWTESIYRYEIGRNTMSSMVSLCLYEPDSAARNDKPSRWATLMGRLLRKPPPPHHTVVVGYGGFWFSRGEVHISTIASHPRFRGLGLGELVLAGMIRRALNMGAATLSLEVRVSNTRAIRLYEKYRFQRHGLKKNYYRDNSEDAYDLRVLTIDNSYYRLIAERWTALQHKINFLDQFSEVPRPHALF